MARKPAAQKRAELNEIRRYLHGGLTYEQIIEVTKQPRSTFYQYLKEIMKEDEERMLEQEHHGLALSINLAKEKLKRSSFNLSTISTNRENDPKVRIDAELANAMILQLLLRIESEQSTIATHRELIHVEKVISQLPQYEQIGHVIEYVNPNEQPQQIQEPKRLQHIKPELQESGNTTTDGTEQSTNSTATKQPATNETDYSIIERQVY